MTASGGAGKHQGNGAAGGNSSAASDRSRRAQDLVLSPPAGTAARTPVPAGVGRNRRVGIRASEACRRCASRSTHHDRPRWQAQCELRAIKVAASGHVRAGLHPARTSATEVDSTRAAAPGLEASGPGRAVLSRVGLLAPTTCTLCLTKNPLFTPTGRTSLLWPDSPTLRRTWPPAHSVPPSTSTPRPPKEVNPSTKSGQVQGCG